MLEVDLCKSMEIGFLFLLFNYYRELQTTSFVQEPQSADYKFDTYSPLPLA
jgi:hypothetical protein